jgi:hypothetical protein
VIKTWSIEYRHVENPSVWHDLGWTSRAGLPLQKWGDSYKVPILARSPGYLRSEAIILDYIRN